MATATAKLTEFRMSPRKIRLLADLIRGMPVANARVELRHNAKHAALPLLKLLNSAVANAKTNALLDEETLVISKITVDGGPMQYRYMPRAQGRATPIRKRSAHVFLELTGQAAKVQKKVEKKKVRKKKEETKKQEPNAENK